MRTHRQRTNKGDNSNLLYANVNRGEKLMRIHNNDNNESVIKRKNV